MSALPVPNRRLRLGEVLMKLGHMNEAQLAQVMVRQRQRRTPLGREVLEAGLCTEGQMFEALAYQAQLPTTDLDSASQAPEAIGVLSTKFAREHRVVALDVRDRVLTIAMTAPASLATQDAVRAVSGRSRLHVVLATDSAMTRALDRFHPLGPAPVQARPPAPPVAIGAELVDRLKLSDRAKALVRRTAAGHGLSSAEVVARVLETWADSVLPKPVKPAQGE